MIQKQKWDQSQDRREPEQLLTVKQRRSAGWQRSYVSLLALFQSCHHGTASTQMQTPCASHEPAVRPRGTGPRWRKGCNGGAAQRGRRSAERTWRGKAWQGRKPGELGTLLDLSGTSTYFLQRFGNGSPTCGKLLQEVSRQGHPHGFPMAMASAGGVLHGSPAAGQGAAAPRARGRGKRKDCVSND